MDSEKNSVNCNLGFNNQDGFCFEYSEYIPKIMDTGRWLFCIYLLFGVSQFYSYNSWFGSMWFIDNLQVGLSNIETITWLPQCQSNNTEEQCKLAILQLIQIKEKKPTAYFIEYTEELYTHPTYPVLWYSHRVNAIPMSRGVCWTG